MGTMTISKEEQRLIDSLNQGFSKILTDTKNLRIGFIRSRFDYIRRYCEGESGEMYNPTNLSGIAHVLTGFRFEAPGSERDPWADYEGREHGLSEMDYIQVLFQEPLTGQDPYDLFMYEFNAYLQTQRVPARLKSNGVQKFWVLA